MLNIMLVDDHEPSLSITALLLRKSGYEVATAINGVDALEKIEQHPPDLVISDILMPVMDGYALCDRLKKDDRFKTIPVFFISSTFVDSQDKTLGLSLGAEAFILKSQDAEAFLGDLQQKIQKCMAIDHTPPLPDSVLPDCKEKYQNALTSELQKKVLQFEGMNRRLHESEERLRSTLASMSDHVLIINKDGDFVEVYHPSDMTELGVSKDQYLGKHFSEIMPQAFIDGFNQIMTKVAKSRDVRQFEYEVEGRSGIKCYQTRVAPFMDAMEKFNGYTIVIRDFTHEKQLVNQLQQAQKMEAMGTLAGGIAHDFNNILTPLLGFAQLLKFDIPNDSGLQESVDEVLRAGARAKNLVKQILTFSRQDDHETIPMKLQSVVKEVLNLLRASFPSTIEIKREIQSDCGVVIANPTQIHQIVMNLATNGYHAMEQSGGVLTISLDQVLIKSFYGRRLSLSPGEYACLSVTDTGVGMDPNIINLIFDPYFTTKKKGKGTGLGLSVVQGIVKKCKGDILVNSKPGEGTTIQVYLPIYQKGEGKPKDDYFKSIVGGTERLLLVDDEIAVVNFLSKMLRHLGYHVESYTEPAAALDKLGSNPDDFDLIISDMTMPKMTGVQMIQKAREVCPGIPGIICTGFSTQIDNEKCKALGIQGLINKPTTVQELANAIRIVFDQQ